MTRMAERLNNIAYQQSNNGALPIHFNPRSVSLDIRTPEELAAVNEFLVTLGRDVSGSNARPSLTPISYFDSVLYIYLSTGQEFQPIVPASVVPSERYPCQRIASNYSDCLLVQQLPREGRELERLDLQSETQRQPLNVYSKVFVMTASRGASTSRHAFGTCLSSNSEQSYVHWWWAELPNLGIN